MNRRARRGKGRRPQSAKVLQFRQPSRVADPIDSDEDPEEMAMRRAYIAVDVAHTGVTEAEKKHGRTGPHYEHAVAILKGATEHALLAWQSYHCQIRNGGYELLSPKTTHSIKFFASFYRRLLWLDKVDSWATTELWALSRDKWPEGAAAPVIDLASVRARRLGRAKGPNEGVRHAQ